MPPELTEAGEITLDLAHLLLKNQRPQLVLELLQNKENGLQREDPQIAEIFRVRALAWQQLGDKRKTRINQISMLEALHRRLGYNHPVFLREIEQFHQQWINEASVDPEELKSLIAWLRQKRSATVSSLVAEEAASVVQVWYGTNRNATGSVDPFRYYGSVIDELQVGKLKITIPPVHKRSVLETPAFWQRADNPDPRKHIVLESISPLTHDAFAEGCCSDDDKLLFIHGYNVSFHDGALRAAQLAYDLEFPGQALYYSWPSQGNLLGYLSDANNVVASRPSLITYLDLITRGPGRLHIIAHSMGNRYLLEALEIFVRDFPDRTIEKIVFAAPDVDLIEFEVRLESLIGRVNSLTLYSSNSDRALQVSKKVNGRPRAGDAGEQIARIKGINAIDASGVGGDSLKHSYFADADLVLADLMGVIKLDWPPMRRCSIARADGKAYWKIRKNGCRLGPLLAVARFLSIFSDTESAKVELESRRANEPDNAEFWSEVLSLLDTLKLGQ